MQALQDQNQSFRRNLSIEQPPLIINRSFKHRFPEIIRKINGILEIRPPGEIIVADSCLNFARHKRSTIFANFL